MSKLLIVSALAAMSVFSSFGFGGTSNSPARSSNSAGHARLSDAELEHIIKAKLAKSKVGKDGFTVHVKGGVATWEGSTGVIQHKGAATRMARTAGVAQVVNNIKISDEARQRASGNLHGGARKAVVKTN